MYLIEYLDNYSTYQILWQYGRDEPTLNAITSFTVANAITDSLKTKSNR